MAADQTPEVTEQRPAHEVLSRALLLADMVQCSALCCGDESTIKDMADLAAQLRALDAEPTWAEVQSALSRYADAPPRQGWHDYDAVPTEWRLCAQDIRKRALELARERSEA